MISRAISLIALVALAQPSCTDLPSYDDPRAAEEFVEQLGTCSGVPIVCRYRGLDTCNSGCAPASTCHSAVLARCSAIASRSSCDSQDGCAWSVNACVPLTGRHCAARQGAECVNDPECDWGVACQGIPRACSDDVGRGNCAANLGCGWEPD
ncbi:MAG: hypothetical protein AB7O24_30060 [Kofleriaceae bacterium]